MKSKNEILYPLLFLLVAAGITIAAGELAIRSIASRTHIYNIEMLKYANELKMRDPEGEISHVHRPNSSSNLMGVEISLNSMGNRSRELKKDKAPDEKRIYVAGSSVTMGWGVPQEQVFTSLTEARLNESGKAHYEFVNSGVGNYGTQAESRLFYRQFPKVKPDMVILHFFIADVEPRGMGNDSAILKNSYLAAYLYNGLSSLAFTGKNHSLFEYYDSLYQDDSPAWQDSQNYIRAMRDFAQEKKIPFLIMIIPDFHSLGPDSPFQTLYPKIEAAIKSMNIPLVNTFNTFQKLYGKNESDLWIQASDPHPNATAHKVMADILYDYFNSAKPLL